MIITIDGPAGSGKSTAARKLAGALNMAYLDTGATYRAATLRALRDGVDMTDERALARSTAEMDLEFIPRPGGLEVRLDGCDVSAEIRTARVTDSIHYLAKSPAVREVLVALQRKIGKRLGSFVTEGRDQGSVVFPDADVKFYLDASAEQRARRRCAEMRQAGEAVQYEEILSAIVERDRRDRSRPAGPLTRPRDAVVVDTSDNTVAQTFDELLAHVEALQ